MKRLEEKSFEEISAADLDSLIGREENQHLEFKETIDKRTDGKRTENWELAKDLASISNGGGGYLIIGVIEDANTKRCSGFRSINDPEGVRKRLKDVGLNYVRGRLSLSPEVRQTSAREQVIWLQIPNSSEPRAVEFDGKTE